MKSTGIKILVTGSNGLLGQKLTDLILQENQNHQENHPIQLIAASRGPNRHPIRQGYLYEELDLLDNERLKQVFEQHRPDCVIHTAALTHVDQCEENPELCNRLNVDLVRDLIALCEAGGTHLIHLSTDFIFDGLQGPYREEDQPNPLSVYGQSKLESEALVKQASCPWTIIRTILVYGILPDLSRSNIVLWAKGALEKGQEIRVVQDQWRMPTLAEDLAQACFSAAKKKATGTFHVSGNELMAITEIVEQVASFWKLDSSLIQPIDSATLNQKAPRPIRTGFHLEKAITQLDYKPKTFWEGLQLVDQQLRKLEHNKLEHNKQ